MNFKSLLGMLGRILSPLWKGAAKKLLASQAASLRVQIEGMIDGDNDASIVRVNRIFDGWQDGIIKSIRGLSFLPASIADTIVEGVEAEGDKLQNALVEGIKSKGPMAVGLAFDGIEAKLHAIIDRA